MDIFNSQKLDALRKILVDKEAEISLLKDSVNEYFNQNDKLKNQVKDLIQSQKIIENENTELKLKIGESTERIKKLENELTDITGRHPNGTFTNEVKETLIQNSFIESFNIKKKYPATLKVKIFEKKPIAILINKKNKFYLSEKIDLIEFKKFPNYQNLPYVLGNKDDFKIFYNNLQKIKFPIDIIKKYTLYETNRWDLETKNNQVIKLTYKNYSKSLKNFLNLKSKNNFEKYELFDYRISNQLILK